MTTVPRSWCPFRTPHIPGVKVNCDDECALYIGSSKLPPEKSCAITAIGLYALQRVVLPDESPGDEEEQPVDRL